MPETTPLEVKRRWLRGEATDSDLEEAQYGGVFYCYWGHSLSLGAAIIGSAWYPGSGIAVAEDEHYAERMTYYGHVREALGDVMRECLKSIVGAVYLIEYRAGNRTDSNGVVRRASEDEKQWQKQHILSSFARNDKLRSFGSSRKGVDRDENQDAFISLPDLGLFLVVDAMGNARAAAITLAVFEEYIREARAEGKLDGVLTQAAFRANTAIMQEANAGDGSLVGMGAQFVALLVADDTIRVAWMGQCRCYREREGQSQLLTKDDYVLGCRGPYDTGIVEEEPFVPSQHQILGAFSEVHVHEIQLGPRMAGDTYLLSTDGLHSLYEDRVLEFFHIAPNETLRQLVSRLMTSAHGDDDATALCVRFGGS